MLSKFEKTIKRVPKFKGFVKSIKKYEDKCLIPNETISWIIKILQEFFKGSKINVHHVAYPSHIGDIWKTVTYITNNKSIIFTTYGKGVSREKAVASGYAELLERIQNGYFFSSNPLKENLISFSNNDVALQSMKLNNASLKLIEEENPYLRFWVDEKKGYMQYYDLINKKNVYFDNRFFRATTGCSAGNTYEEAFIQGLCEVFERYAVVKTLMKKISCPTIPIKRVSKRVQSYIKELEDQKIQVIIKDLSMGVKIPVVGVLLCYERDGDLPIKFREFRAGSAPSLDVAVERSLTETLQTDIDLDVRIYNSNKVLSRFDVLYKTFTYLDEFIPMNVLAAFHYPRHGYYFSQELEFLEENCGESIYWDYSEEDCYNEANLLIDLCKRMKWIVYMRDYNWLGFPAIRVFVPQLNLGHNDHAIPTKKIREFKDIILKVGISNLTLQDLEILESNEFLIYCLVKINLRNFFGISTSDLERTSVWKFFGLLALEKGRTELAKLYFKQLIKENPSDMEDIFNFSSKRELIIPYIQSLLPDCSKPCKTCTSKSECRDFQLKGLENYVAENFPDFFKIKNQWSEL